MQTHSQGPENPRLDAAQHTVKDSADTRKADGWPAWEKQPLIARPIGYRRRDNAKDLSRKAGEALQRGRDTLNLEAYHRLAWIETKEGVTILDPIRKGECPPGTSDFLRAQAENHEHWEQERKLQEIAEAVIQRRNASKLKSLEALWEEVQEELNTIQDVAADMGPDENPYRTASGSPSRERQPLEQAREAAYRWETVVRRERDALGAYMKGEERKLLPEIRAANEKAIQYAELRGEDAPGQAEIPLGKWNQERTRFTTRKAGETPKGIAKTLGDTELAYLNEMGRASGHIHAGGQQVVTETSRKYSQRQKKSTRHRLNQKRIVTAGGHVFTLQEAIAPAEAAERKRKKLQRERLAAQVIRPAELREPEKPRSNKKHETAAPLPTTEAHSERSPSFAFLTVTLPGNMHAAPGSRRVSTFDGTPVKRSAKILSSVKRDAQQGFIRAMPYKATYIVGIEPHEDGTPHMHMVTNTEYGLELAARMGTDPRISDNRAAVRVITIHVKGGVSTTDPRAKTYRTAEDMAAGRYLLTGHSYPAAVEARVFLFDDDNRAEAQNVARKVAEYLSDYTEGYEGHLPENIQLGDTRPNYSEWGANEADNKYIWRNGYSVETRTVQSSDSGLAKSHWHLLNQVAESKSRDIPPAAKASARLVLSAWAQGRMQETREQNGPTQVWYTIGSGPDLWVFTLNDEKKGRATHPATQYRKERTARLMETTQRFENRAPQMETRQVLKDIGKIMGAAWATAEGKADQTKNYTGTPGKGVATDGGGAETSQENQQLGKKGASLSIYQVKRDTTQCSSPAGHRPFTPGVAAAYLMTEGGTPGAVCMAAAGGGKSYILAQAAKTASRKGVENVVILCLMRKTVKEMFHTLTQEGVPAVWQRARAQGGALGNGIPGTAVTVATVAKWQLIHENYPGARIIIDEMQDIPAASVDQIRRGSLTTESSIRLAVGDDRQTLMPNVEPSEVAKIWSGMNTYNLEASRRCADDITEFAHAMAPALDEIRGNVSGN